MVEKQRVQGAQNEAMHSSWFGVGAFMWERLGLIGCVRDVYAMIHSYTTDRRFGVCYATAEYMSVVTGYSVRSIYRALKSLKARGLVQRLKHCGKWGYRALASTAARGDRSDKSTDPASQVSDGTATGSDPAKAPAKIPDNAPANPPERATEGTPIGYDTVAEKCDTVADCGMGQNVTPNMTQLQSEACNPVSPYTNGINIGIKRVSNTSSSSSYSVARRYPGQYLDEDEQVDDRQVKYRVLSFGREGFVGLTAAQYESLASLVDYEKLVVYIRRLEMLIADPTAHKPHSHYRTLKKWIEDDLSVS